MLLQRMRFVSLAIILSSMISCSSPPIIRHTVADADFRAVNVTFLGRANSMKEDWESAKKEMAAEKTRSKVLELDRRLAKVWVKAAQLQLKRAKLTPPANPGDKNMKPYKSSAQAEKELELAQKHLSLVERQLKLNRKRMELLKWKVYAAQARYLEEVVLALHKAQAPAAGKYSKLKFNDQTHALQRKFLLREEKMASLETEVKAMEKEIEEQWGPALSRAAGAAKAGPCPACPACPAAAPCKCPAVPPDGLKPGSDAGSPSVKPAEKPETDTPK